MKLHKFGSYRKPFKESHKPFSFVLDTMWFTLLLVTLCSLSTIHGYSGGAGQAVCQTNEMRPRHSGLNFNQNDPSVTINAVKNGNILDIEVQCRVAGGFKGSKNACAHKIVR